MLQPVLLPVALGRLSEIWRRPQLQKTQGPEDRTRNFEQKSSLEFFKELQKTQGPAIGAASDREL